MTNRQQLYQFNKKKMTNAAANGSGNKAAAVVDNRPGKAIQAKGQEEEPIQAVLQTSTSAGDAVFQLGRKRGRAEYEESDDEYIEPQPRAKSKKKDAGSNIKEGTYKKKNNRLEYETVGGAKHLEIHDPDEDKTITESTNLTYRAEFRNPTHKDKNQFKVHNPYGLSVGQQGLNQPIISHSTPSWAGFQAGGKFGNRSLTSSRYNSRIEKKEKEFRKEVEHSAAPFSYKTETEYEDIDPDDASDIEKALKDPKTGKLPNPKWNKKRIRKRIEKVKEADPELKRVKRERRVFSFGKNRKKTFSQDRDLHLALPRRAYDPEAHRKYIEARGQDSEGSDAELEEPPKKKRKRGR